MNQTIKKVLNKLEINGFEAYITGGFVRDHLLGIKSFDVDICTNALPKELTKIFPISRYNGLGGISFNLKKYRFEITTYRKELKYANRKPISFKFTNDLLIDLQRRDFTINAFIMNKKGQIQDYLSSYQDLDTHLIKIIGDNLTKIQEDPLRMLRAVRFASTLNFQLEKELYNSIKNNNLLITTLSNTRIKEELDKILLSDNPLYGLTLLKELGILDIIHIRYSNIVPVNSLVGMYAQLDININLPFTKSEKYAINKLKEILKSQSITKYTIYEYDDYLIEVASKIFNVDAKKIKKITKELPIKCLKDIKISPSKITKILDIPCDKNLRIIYKELENLIINGKIKNTHNSITKYLKDHKNKWFK